MHWVKLNLSVGGMGLKDKPVEKGDGFRKGIRAKLKTLGALSWCLMVF